MPTVIDSLFLELGIDTSKFSSDQKRALEKIAQFEKHAKRSADKAAGSVKTVGKAFRDLADDSRIGAGAHRLDTFAAKLKGLGQAAQVSGGAGTPLGKMAEGLGALLSPAALGIAAVGLLGKGMWDLNERMTAANATIFRQAQLSGMNAKSLWAWGEAAKTVGGSASGTRAGIANLQTAVMGGMIGAGMPTAQLVGLARLGVKWNATSGVDIKSLFERVHAVGKKEGWARTWALVSSSGLMNESEFNLAMSKGGGYAAYEYAQRHAPQSLRATLRDSLKDQSILGKLGIRKDILAETAQGGVRGPMAALVTLMTHLLGATNALLGWTIKIAGYLDMYVTDWVSKFFTGATKTSMPALVGGVSVAGALPGSIYGRQTMAMRALMGRGLSRTEAAAIVGNMAQESSLNPAATSDHGAHIGLGQWDAARQKAFAKKFGYRIGSPSVSARQQFLDELMFSTLELSSSQKRAAAKMGLARGLAGKTRAFEQYDERPGDHSFARRLFYAREAYEAVPALSRLLAAANPRRGFIQRNVTHHTQIGAVNVSTQATDAKGMAAGARKALSAHPLIAPEAQHKVTLSSRGMTG